MTSMRARGWVAAVTVLVALGAAASAVTAGGEPAVSGADSSPVGVSGGTSGPVRLSTTAPTTRTIAVVSPRGVPGGFRGFAKRAEGRVLLRIENVTYDRSPGVGYKVYVDLPGAAASAAREHYVGSLSFYGVRSGAVFSAGSRTFEITDLARAGALDRGTVAITVRPFDLTVPASPRPVVPDAEVTIGRISIETIASTP
jgi:hypothetical protein